MKEMHDPSDKAPLLDAQQNYKDKIKKLFKESPEKALEYALDVAERDTVWGRGRLFINAFYNSSMKNDNKYSGSTHVTREDLKGRKYTILKDDKHPSGLQIHFTDVVHNPKTMKKEPIKSEGKIMNKATGLLSLLNLVEDSANVDRWKDSLIGAQSSKHRKDLIKAAMAKGDKFAVKMGLMKLNKESPLDPREYNDLLNYMDDLEKKPPASSTKSKGFLSRFF